MSSERVDPAVRAIGVGHDDVMRSYFANAPWWVLSLLSGLVFGTWMTVWNGTQTTDSWATALVLGAISGALFGAFIGPIAARAWRRQRAVAGDLPAENFRRVSKSAARGPAPADPEVRAAATRLAAHQLAESIRFRTLGIITFGLGVVISLGLAVTDSPWWLVSTAAFCGSGASLWWWPRHLRHRINVLTPAQGSEPHPGE